MKKDSVFAAFARKNKAKDLKQARPYEGYRENYDWYYRRRRAEEFCGGPTRDTLALMKDFVKKK